MWINTFTLYSLENASLQTFGDDDIRNFANCVANQISNENIDTEPSITDSVELKTEFETLIKVFITKMKK